MLSLCRTVHHFWIPLLLCHHLSPAPLLKNRNLLNKWSETYQYRAVDHSKTFLDNSSLSFYKASSSRDRMLSLVCLFHPRSSKFLLWYRVACRLSCFVIRKYDPYRCLVHQTRLDLATSAVAIRIRKMCIFQRHPCRKRPLLNRVESHLLLEESPWWSRIGLDT